MSEYNTPAPDSLAVAGKWTGVEVRSMPTVPAGQVPGFAVKITFVLFAVFLQSQYSTVFTCGVVNYQGVYDYANSVLYGCG